MIHTQASKSLSNTLVGKKLILRNYHFSFQTLLKMFLLLRGEVKLRPKPRSGGFQELGLTAFGTFTDAGASPERRLSRDQAD